MTPRTKPVLAVFDVCDTLYAGNTTIALLEILALKHPRVASALHRWRSRRSPYFYLGALAHHLLGLDLARNRLIAALMGIPRRDLEMAGSRLAGDVLPGLANTELHERLERHRDAGDVVVLITNSLDAAVAPIAKALGVQFRASELAYERDICAGRLKSDLTGRKGVVLAGMADLTDVELWVYTDNRSDADLLALAQVPTIVLPQSGSQREWGGKNSRYVRL